jgi:hypothetical protein
MRQNLNLKHGPQTQIMVQDSTVYGKIEPDDEKQKVAVKSLPLGFCTG